ncbi:alpha/beta hydrolase [Cellulomonas cellasea]|uniref:Alpha/beta hydrolase n=1 Tax=Cellulomonas cellasea TaxID=43670 RepID=A0A4Y3KUB3_9CELL|nr:alpha/beta hydrolase [Cellulomonas cellasea]GEA88019.1 alpha/beta hydrolase [Cellulomonas cellasea]
MPLAPRDVRRAAEQPLAAVTPAPLRPVSRAGRPLMRAAGLLAVGALVLAGCSSPKNQVTVDPSAPASAGEGVAPELAEFYEQQPEWTACGDLECTTVVVPIDWEEPGGGSIELAVNRSRATGGDRIGSLLTNPGGPGASGTEALETVVIQRMGAGVKERYDLVGFDPRGVGKSHPVECVDGAEMDELVAFDADYSTPEGLEDVEARYGEFAAGCLERTGEVLEHIDTVSAARDLDVLRAVLGDEQLHYLGFSYGTALGATYASLFPERVGRLVLDGALDPTLDSDAIAAGQAAGFESALRAYVTDCQAGKSCPLEGTVDEGLAAVADLLEDARRNPLETTDPERPLTASLAFAGIAQTLYANTLWPYLTEGLTGAIQQRDGSRLLQFADLYYDRDPDGTYGSNTTEAFWAIGCADDRATTDPDEMRASAERMVEAAPTIGRFFGYGGVVCARWPVPEAGGLDSYTAEGAAPIVVIGTTNDPATPYVWAESLSDVLSSAVLLTFEGEGHTAYGRSNECITGAVDAYLLEGTVPEDGTRC